MDLWVVFLTGLTVGGLTCFAVQGGLLASVIAAQEEEEIEKKVNKKNPLIPTSAFLISKLIAYSALGFLLGAFGEAMSLSQASQITLQFIAGVYMVAVALNLLEIHPIFRYTVIQPPRFLAKKLKNQSRSKDFFAPALLGAMTIFIPCGTTLAMEALAISSGSALSGAAIMGVFILGTTPFFFGVGWLTSVLGDNYREKFLKIAAVAIIYLGVMSINGALIAIDSPFAIKSLSQKSAPESTVEISNNPEIFVLSNGYSPNNIRVNRNQPVRLKLTSKDAYSCASAFRIPSLGISKNLQANETVVVEFTPTEAGQIAFSCSMGMYSGIIEVI